MRFEAIFGLRINLSKSTSIPFGAVGNVEELAFELGFKARGFLPRIWVFLLGLLIIPLGCRTLLKRDFGRD